MSDAYGPLARVYDLFTQDVDYDALYAYLHQIMKTVHADPASVLDLACGTGSITVRFAADGYQVIGADLSEDMLTIAMDKATAMKQPPFFIHQPMPAAAASLFCGPVRLPVGQPQLSDHCQGCDGYV